MREIKFRAWKDGEMMYQPLGTHYGLYRFIGFIPEESPLMQYTGLKDKNGKEIYEGDILEHDQWGVKVVKDIRDTFRTNSAAYDAVAYSEEDTQSDCSTVIGNIYQNPELLEES